jgi:hypothetical protein
MPKLSELNLLKNYDASSLQNIEITDDLYSKLENKKNIDAAERRDLLEALNQIQEEDLQASMKEFFGIQLGDNDWVQKLEQEAPHQSTPQSSQSPQPSTAPSIKVSDVFDKNFKRATGAFLLLSAVILATLILGLTGVLPAIAVGGIVLGAGIAGAVAVTALIDKDNRAEQARASNMHQFGHEQSETPTSDQPKAVPRSELISTKERDAEPGAQPEHQWVNGTVKETAQERDASNAEDQSSGNDNPSP